VVKGDSVGLLRDRFHRERPRNGGLKNFCASKKSTLLKYFRASFTHGVFTGIFPAFDQGHLQRGQDKKEAKKDQDPRVTHDQFGSKKEHATAHDQSSQNTPEKYAVLILPGNGKETENHGDDKDIVHGQGFPDHKGGQVLNSCYTPCYLTKNDCTIPVFGGV